MPGPVAPEGPGAQCVHLLVPAGLQRGRAHIEGAPSVAAAPEQLACICDVSQIASVMIGMSLGLSVTLAHTLAHFKFARSIGNRSDSAFQAPNLTQKRLRPDRHRGKLGGAGDGGRRCVRACVRA